MASPREPTFINDLTFAGRTWRTFPWLPAVSVVLTLPIGILLPERLWIIGLLQLLVYAGWIGVERIAYLRALRREPLKGDELSRLIRAFVPRYAVLGILMSLLFTPAVLIAFWQEPGHAGPSTAGVIATSVLAIAVDVFLTFVTPALAYTTRKVSFAIGVGIRMLRSEWPACLWYVLVPPLAIAIVAQLFVQWSGSIAALSTAISTLLNVWFKGATAAFYLRRHATGRDGAAFASPQEQAPLPPPPPYSPNSR